MDEIDHLVNVFGKLRYRKLSTLAKRLLAEGLEEQRRVTGTRRSWGVFHFWGRTECVSHSSFTLVLANDHSHPSSREVIVLDEQQERFLLPFYKSEDFFAFASLLGIESLRGYATLVAFITMERSPS